MSKLKNEVWWGFILCTSLNWFALSSALLRTHRPQSLTVDNRAVTQGTCTPGRSEQKCGTQSVWSKRHSPARVARVSSLWPLTLQTWHSAYCKQITKMSTLIFPNLLTVLSCAKHCKARYGLSAASQGRLNTGAWLTINVFTPLILLSFPKSDSHQGTWQFPDKLTLCRCTSFTTFLSQYSVNLVPCSWGIW